MKIHLLAGIGTLGRSILVANLNIEKTVIEFLDANKPDGWHVYGDMQKSARKALF